MSRSHWGLHRPHRALPGPVSVLVLNRGKDLVHVEVVRIAYEGAQEPVSGIGPDTLDDLIFREQKVRLVLHEADENLNQRREGQALR